MMRTMLHYAEKARWPTRHSFNPKDFLKKVMLRTSSQKKSGLILWFFNSFTLLSFESKSDLFSRSWNLGRQIWILHSQNPMFLQSGNKHKETLGKQKNRWRTHFPGQDLKNSWNATAGKSYPLAARETFIVYYGKYSGLQPIT